MLLFFVHPVAELFAWLEVRDKLAVEADRLTRLWITAYAGGAVMQREAAEAAYFNTVARRKALRHLLKHGLDANSTSLDESSP
jgi:hypothetical protein